MKSIISLYLECHEHSRKCFVDWYEQRKAEKMKASAEETMADKLAATKRIAEEKRANAEAKLSKKSVRTSEKADYIRRTGHLPSSFSFKLPFLCCW